MTLTTVRPIRILQVVGEMNRGGLETWLMHILRHVDRDRFHFDFLVHTTEPCAYDDEIRHLGSKVIPCMHPWQPLTFARNFKRIVRGGSYDIIHSHIHHYSGYVLRLAKQAGIPVRIAHSHIDTSTIESSASLSRRLYLTLMQRWIARYATHGLGCSRNAATNLFGSTWETDPARKLLYLGIDLTLFRNPVDLNAVRTELGISPTDFVIGHVGRFDPQKNHVFLIEIAAEIAKREPNMRLLLVGRGPLHPEIEQKVAQMGWRDRVIFAGSRSDVPRLMLGAMDVFLLPSLYEGLPLVLIEAQSAGLPCIFSDSITQEVEIVNPLMRRMSLSQSASTWAEAILAFRERKNSLNALAIVENSPFNVVNCLSSLQKIYTHE